MNGADLITNMVDELERARRFISKYFEEHPAERETLTEDELLLDDIQNDLERYYDNSDSIDAVLLDIEIDD